MMFLPGCVETLRMYHSDGLPEEIKVLMVHVMQTVVLEWFI